MIVIQDVVFADITIGQQPIGAAANLFNTLFLIEGVASLCPSMQLLLNDHADVLKKQFSLSDGNQISVILGRRVDDVKTTKRNYVLYSVKEVMSATGPITVLTGYLDTPKYMTEACTESYDGTSEEVLKQIADKCELKFSGPGDVKGKQMNDKQVWLNMGQSRAVFAQNLVSRHSFADEQSGMACAITGLGEMRFRNLIDCVNVDPQSVQQMFIHNGFYSGEDSSKIVYAVHEAEYKSDAGLVNNLVNYGATYCQHDLKGEQIDHTKLDVPVDDGYLAINMNISNAANNLSRIDYMNLDQGNTHDNFYKAQYQNQRIQGLFTERVSLLVIEPTAVNTFDAVVFKKSNISDDEPAKEADVYIVVGKTLMLKGGTTYAERVELARMTVKEMGNTQLAGPESDVTGEQMIQQTAHGLPQCTYDVNSASYDTSMGMATTIGLDYSAAMTVALNVPDAFHPIGIRISNMIPLMSQMEPTYWVAQGLPNPVFGYPVMDTSIPGISVDPYTGLLQDSNTGYIYDPSTGQWQPNPGPLITAATRMVPLLRAFNTSVAAAVTLLASTANSIVVLNTTAQQESKSTSVAVSVLLQTGGPIDVVARAMPMISVMLTVHGALSAIASYVPPMTTSSNAGNGTADFSVVIESLDNNYATLWLSLARIWNTLVSATYGNVPQPLDSNWVYVEAVLSESITDSTGAPRSTATVADLFKTEAMKLNDGSQPRWLTETPPAGIMLDPSQKFLRQLNSSIKTTRRQGTRADQFV